ncbi:hypothetical protein HNY73_000303 [Argiope bruennichi]|uniref:Uncharacterized protein n=1 Tax=Argiope bruennichi TaxID=94029 RepID=A0A8T0FXS5_ARGBR|nr:hypothetical protein HNY73_000303 [Argiope bruennichi]
MMLRKVDISYDDGGLISFFLNQEFETEHEVACFIENGICWVNLSLLSLKSASHQVISFRHLFHLGGQNAIDLQCSLKAEHSSNIVFRDGGHALQ